jgi:hypothetical protein
VRTFDTQTAPVARITLKRGEVAEEWSGFWCLSVGKAPKGAFDDVRINLDAGRPQWFSLDPAEPLTITALDTVR